MKKVFFLLLFHASLAAIAQSKNQFITFRLEKKTADPVLQPLVTALQSEDYTFAKLAFKTSTLRLLASRFRKKNDEILFVLTEKTNCGNHPPKKILELSANGKDLHRYWAFQYQKLLGKPKLDSAAFLAREKKYQKAFKNFLKARPGHFRNVPDSSRWAVDVPASYTSQAAGYEAGFVFVQQGKPVAAVHLDTVFGVKTEHFVQVDSANCVPVNRFLNYKQGFGTTYRRTELQVPYHPRPRHLVEKEFVLLFPKNKTSVEASDIQPILQFLKANRYIIYTAAIAGFASVEGDSLNNSRLQEERADVLVKLLKKNNPDTIEASIRTRENWELFYSQIKNTPFADWQNRSHAETKKWLENDSTQALLEPLLAPQRKAVLTLKVAEKLTPLQKQEITKQDYEQAISRLNSAAFADKDRQALLRKAASVRHYLQDGLRNHTLPATFDCNEILKNTTPDLSIIDFYEAVADFRTGRLPACGTLAEVVKKAFEASIVLINTAVETKNAALYLAQALDIQAFTFEQLLNHHFPARMLCELAYPDRPLFRDLYLSRLSFESQEGKQVFEEAACPKEVKPEGVSRLYYRLLRDLVLTGKEATEFDLYELLYYSVLNFDEKKRTFYDETVNEKVMLQLMQKLTAGQGRLCPVQYHQLFLDFYVKYTFFQASHPQLKRSEKIKQTAANLNLIKKYFLQRLAPAQASQLLSLAQLYVFYAGVLNDRSLLTPALEILEKALGSEKNSPDLLRYYLQLAVLLPGKEAPSQNLLTYAEKMPLGDWCQLFRGKGGITLEGADLSEVLKKYCEQCK